MAGATDPPLAWPMLLFEDLVDFVDAPAPVKNVVHAEILSSTTITTKKKTNLVLTPDAQRRRRRRLDREKKRTQGVKDRIEQLRSDLVALLTRRNETARRVTQGLHNAPPLQQFLPLVYTAEQLFHIQQTQNDALQEYQVHLASLALQAAYGNQFRIPIDDAKHESMTTSAMAKRAVGSEWILMDPVTLLESMLLSDPLTPHEAEAFVTDTCREMTQSLAQPDWMGGPQEFGGGLSGGRCVAGTLLEFRLAKRLEGVSAQTLVEKTWNLLTKLDQYRRIQPQTAQLRVLQRVTDSSWVVGIAVGARHSLVLVGRAVVDGGYIVTFRSLPLVRNNSNTTEFARQHFVESETGGIHANTFSWYNFKERPSAAGVGVDCDVSFGGTARNIHPDYLNQLQLEVVAGFARWQAAVGFPHVLFLAPLTST